jgi:hypothetical protein
MLANSSDSSEVPATPQERVAWAVMTALPLVRRALSPLPGRELSGDPNKGVTELGFKLAWMTALCAVEPDLTIESERVVEGGRIDLLLALGTHVEVLELKYVRVGFLDRVRFTKKWLIFHARCRVANTALNSLTRNDFWNQMFRRYQFDSSSGQPVYRMLKRGHRVRKFDLVSIAAECRSGRKQAQRYCKTLETDAIDPLPLGPARSLGYHVIVGAGTRVEIYANKRDVQELPAPSAASSSSLSSSSPSPSSSSSSSSVQ